MAGTTEYPRDIIKNRKTQLNGVNLLAFPNNLGAHATLLVFKKYSYESPGSRNLNKIDNTTLTNEQLGSSAILLPLPREIKDTYGVEITNFDQGMFGDAISRGGNYVMGDGSVDGSVLENMGIPSTQTLVSTAGGAIGTLASKFLSSRTSGLGAGAVGALLPGNGNIASSLEAGAGMTVNPKQALQFKGVDMKTHNFSWSMAPKSPDESDKILQITTAIKQNALPSYTNIGPVKRAFLNYPSTVDIYFFGIDQNYFMFFKTCMINTVNIDYSPQGMAVLRGGKPAMVNLSLSLKEMDIHTAEDYGGQSTDIGISNIGSERF